MKNEKKRSSGAFVDENLGSRACLSVLYDDSKSGEGTSGWHLPNSYLFILHLSSFILSSSMPTVNIASHLKEMARRAPDQLAVLFPTSRDLAGRDALHRVTRINSSTKKATSSPRAWIRLESDVASRPC